MRDSLLNIWNDKTESDTNRLNALYKISWDIYVFNQPDSAFYFAQLQYDFAEEKGLRQQQSIALNTQGVSFFIKGDYSNAVDYYKRSLTIREELGDKKGIAASLNNIANIYHNQGDYVNAIDYHTRSLTIKEEINDQKGIAFSLGNIGLIYSDQNRHEKAADYHSRSLKIREEIEDEQGMALSLINLGVIDMNQGDDFNAVNYFARSLVIYENLGDKMGIGTALKHLGDIYRSQESYLNAIDYYQRSLSLYKGIEYKEGLVASFYHIGLVYKAQGDSLFSAGNIPLSIDEYAYANINFTKALVLARELGLVNKVQGVAIAMYELYKTIGEHELALEMYELYITSKDSVDNEMNQKELLRQEYKHRYEKEHLSDSIAFVQQKKIEELLHVTEMKKEANQRYVLYGGIGFLLLLGGIILRGYRRKKKDNELITEKNTEILDSIKYAKRIQNAILPSDKIIKEYLPESFILYKPKDIVAGDFYWLEFVPNVTASGTRQSHSEEEIASSFVNSRNDVILFAAADCTGHGVPGAMVSVICNNGLNRSVRECGLTDPGQILDKTREIVIQEFEKSEDEVKDGMDIALCSLSTVSSSSGAYRELQYAGAHNPLWIVRKGTLLETKANRQPIGQFDMQTSYTTHVIELQKGDSIYIFSDGYVDQFGGEKGKKFKSRAFKDLLLSIQERTMKEQKSIIEEVFENWRGDFEQVDDVCVIGVRI